MAKRPPEQKPNGYQDEDLQQIIDEIEGLKDEKTSIMAEAAGRCSGIAKKIANAKKTAKALGIPTRSLNALLKVRDLERKIDAASKDVPEDEIELFADMTGQFSFLKPEKGQTAAQAAATSATEAAAAHHQAEQEAGARVLDELTGVQH